MSLEELMLSCDDDELKIITQLSNTNPQELVQYILDRRERLTTNG